MGYTDETELFLFFRSFTNNPAPEGPNPRRLSMAAIRPPIG